MNTTLFRLNICMHVPLPLTGESPGAEAGNKQGAGITDERAAPGYHKTEQGELGSASDPCIGIISATCQLRWTTRSFVGGLASVPCLCARLVQLM